MTEKFGVADRCNEIKKSAGRDFLTGFFQRHPDLSIREPEATSINRILGFNKAEVDQFFDKIWKKSFQNTTFRHLKFTIWTRLE